MNREFTISELKLLRESEDKVEFKEAKHNFPFNGGSHSSQTDRRKCFLGYVVALANDGGGILVLGMKNEHPHEVVGTDYALGAIGAIEDQVYKMLGIRTHIVELFEGTSRVMVTYVPSRPIGEALKFEGVPLTRIGDSLRNMSDQEHFAVMSEQEPDFSAKVCEEITFQDLDQQAIEVMRNSYAQKQSNPRFKELSVEQALSDLRLFSNGKLTYAALILLGKKEIIAEHLPQSRVIWEYRIDETQIHHDQRHVIEGPLYLSIEDAWAFINQPALNTKNPVMFGAYIFDIYDFNEQVIREALLNAVAHRDYTITSEVVIKQYPESISIQNPGGFPKGVTLENLLIVSSTPRCRLLTEVLEKTGLVERSGQGVDKIYSITLSEGKAEPDYNSSDLFQVTLKLRSEIIDQAFHVFLREYQESDKEPKLGVEQIITLCKVRSGISNGLKQSIIDQLLKMGLIQRIATASKRLSLSDDYLKLVSDNGRIGKRYLVNEVAEVVLLLQVGMMKIGQLSDVLHDKLTRNQIRFILQKLIEDRIVVSEGQLKGTKYGLHPHFQDYRGSSLVNEVTTDLKLKYDNP